MSDPSARPRVVPIRDESIRLGQFLKLADLVDHGSEAKPLLADGLVTVNGEVETRRGRQLAKGDIVTLHHPEGDPVATNSPATTAQVG
jgi:ribosome-associated protein